MIVGPGARDRRVCGALLLLTVVAGLASREYPTYQPSIVAEFAGDALWASAVFWSLALVMPRARTQRLALSSAAIAYAVELSQLSRASWLEVVRETHAGALFLGRGFLWSDLLMYGLGILAAVTIDVGIRRR